MKHLALLASLVLLLTCHIAVAAPKKGAPDDGEKVHIVAPGQTLAKIAKRYRVSVQNLRDANDLSPGVSLKPGARLVIPSDDVPADRSSKKSHAKAAQDEDRDSEDDDSGKKSKKGKSKDKDRDKDRDDDDKKSRKSKTSADKDDDDAVKPGHVRLVRGDQSWEGKVLVGKGSKVTPQSSQAFSRLLAPEGGKSHSIDARLVALVATVSDHFGGRPIEVVSGFRPKTSKQATAHSKHNSGSAIDFHIPGVRNDELRDFVRTLKKVGVGYYPNSSFVHLDVRPQSTYWVDTSRPGESPKYLHDEPKEGEEKADAKDDDKKKDRSLAALALGCVRRLGRGPGGSGGSRQGGGVGPGACAGVERGESGGRWRRPPQAPPWPRQAAAGRGGSWTTRPLRFSRYGLPSGYGLPGSERRQSLRQSVRASAEPYDFWRPLPLKRRARVVHEPPLPAAACRGQGGAWGGRPHATAA